MKTLIISLMCFASGLLAGIAIGVVGCLLMSPEPKVHLEAHPRAAVIQAKLPIPNGE